MADFRLNLDDEFFDKNQTQAQEDAEDPERPLLPEHRYMDARPDEDENDDEESSDFDQWGNPKVKKLNRKIMKMIADDKAANINKTVVPVTDPEELLKYSFFRP
jgi:hypothetical protein